MTMFSGFSPWRNRRTSVAAICAIALRVSNVATSDHVEQA
jgi:hypothetical protein